MKKQNKTKIGVRSVVKEKVGYLENIKRWVRIRGKRKEVVVYVQTVTEKNKLLVQLKDGNKKDISYSLLMFLISKEKVEMDKPLSHSLKK